MFEKWNEELRKKVKDDESRKGDILVRVVHETFDFDQHNMLLEEGALQEEMKEFTRADLQDYLNLERNYGRTD